MIIKDPKFELRTYAFYCDHFYKTVISKGFIKNIKITGTKREGVRFEYYLGKRWREEDKIYKTKKEAFEIEDKFVKKNIENRIKEILIELETIKSQRFYLKKELIYLTQNDETKK